VKRAAPARGFTLIEVLVALAIVAIGMAAVMSALNSSADTVLRMRDKTFAQWVALNQLATLRLSGQTPAVGSTNGDLDYAGSSWHWKQDVVASDVPGVMRIDVSVRPKDAKGGDDSGWYATLSGIYGDAVAPARGDTPDWGSQLLQAGSANPVGTPGAPGVQGTAGVSGTAPYAAPGASGAGAIGSGTTLGSGSGLGSDSNTLGGSTPGGSAFDTPTTTAPPPPPPSDAPNDTSSDQ
jgi:general secretion pathway protein I